MSPPFLPQQMPPQIPAAPAQLGNLGNPQLPNPAQMPPPINPAVAKVYDLTQGKYDLAVEAGPSYTTRREEAADMITQFIQAAPNTAPILGPMLAKMSDWPESDKVSDLLATMMPPEAKAIFTGKPVPPPGPPPEVMIEQAKAQAQMQMEAQKAQHQAQLNQQAAQNKIQLEREQAQADMATMRDKAALEMQLARERAAMEAELKQREAELAARLKVIGAQQAAVTTPSQIEQ